MPDPIFYLTRKVGELPKGTVCLGETPIGAVYADNKVAAGTNGERRRFWTAVPVYPGPHDRMGRGASIGTRFPTRRDAVSALVRMAREEGTFYDPSAPVGWPYGPAFEEARQARNRFVKRVFSDHRPRHGGPNA